MYDKGSSGCVNITEIWWQVKIREPQTPSDAQSYAVLVIQRVQGSQGLVNVQWRLNAAAQDDFVPPLEGIIQFIQVKQIDFFIWKK